MREDRDDRGGEKEDFIHDSTYFILVQCFTTQTAFEYMISMEEKMAPEFLGKGH